jgi:NodT family efflux transporter outer membrane factor (OMF) lipoprotein
MKSLSINTMWCHRQASRITVCLSTVGAICVLAGCTVGPRYRAPAPPTVTTYTPESQPSSTFAATGPAGSAQHLNPAMDIPAQWWTLFQSPELDRLVREALANSPTLAQATARLEQAQEEANARTGATRYPSVSASISAQREQVDLATFGVPFPSPPPFGLLNGSVAVSYALDLFGANRRLVEGLNAQVEYQNWQLQGARLMLAGNVVSAAIRQAQLRSQIDLTRQMLSLQQQQLAITERRVQAGGLAPYNVSQQRTLVEQTRAAIPALEQQLDVVNHQLAVLIGKSPAEAQIEAISLDTLHLPEDLPVSLPSSLVRQRPDIRAAESLMHQASANVGVATANLYPQITLSASGGGIGTSFTQGGPVWSIGGALAQPIFNGGALRAEKRKAMAAYEEAGANYQQVVLLAFEQVADTLRAVDHDAQTLQARSEASAQAESTYNTASQRYLAGGISQLSLIDAQRQYLLTAIDRTNAAASRYSDSAVLFQALGGGWWNEPQATKPASTSSSNSRKSP